METKVNTIYFESDDEFTDFCVAPYAEIKPDEHGMLTYAGDYSDLYKQYLQQGMTFVIKDEDSKVYKRQCVCKRVPVMYNGRPMSRTALVQLDVENLEEYFVLDIAEEQAKVTVHNGEDIWESDTPEVWKESMDYFASKYEGKIGEIIMDFLKDNVGQLFNNPREVEDWLLKRIVKLKEKGFGFKMWTPEYVLDDMLEPVLRFKLDDRRNAKIPRRDKRPDSKPAQKEAAVKLAKMVSDFIQGR